MLRKVLVLKLPNCSVKTGKFMSIERKYEAFLHGKASGGPQPPWGASE